MNDSSVDFIFSFSFLFFSKLVDSIFFLSHNNKIICRELVSMRLSKPQPKEYKFKAYGLKAQPNKKENFPKTLAPKERVRPETTMATRQSFL